MEKLWHSQAKGAAQDHLRPVHGRLSLVLNKECIDQYTHQYPASCASDVWTSPDDRSIQVRIMEDSCQQVLLNTRPGSHTSPGDQQYNAKMSRSQSFSENEIKMDYLMAPDPRRYSFASNESGMSPSSSMSEMWNYELAERKKNFSPIFKTESLREESEFHVNSDIHHSIKDNFGYNSDHFHINNSIENSTDFLRRSSGFSSDSERTSRRPSSNFDRRSSRFSVDISRRDSELSCLSDRRSSGFVSDFDRRDSSSSNSSIGHFLGHPDTIPPCHSPVPAQSGMEHVPHWLKSLRLHKYTDMLMGMSYAEMTELTEEKLERLHVTKGARRKIVASVQKLLERPKMLATIDSELESEDCDVKKVLVELETLVKSPIKIEEEDDLRRRHDSARDSGAEVSEDEEQERGLEIHCSGRKLTEMILNSLRKACSLILLSQNTDTKNVALLTNLLDLCLSHNCYLPLQKQLLLSWKHKLYSIWGPLPSPHQNINHKEKPFHLKTPPIAPPNSSGQYSGLPTNCVGWTHHLNQENKERLAVPLLGEPSHQGKVHPFLMQRKSAPSIESSFVLPSYQKRYSFQDGAIHPRASLQHRYSLPTIEPRLPPTVMKNDQEHPMMSRLDSDWRSGLHNLGLKFPDFQCEQERSSEGLGMNSEEASVNLNTREKNPNTILVTGVETPSDNELNSRLECLCRAVTEQALD